ncbi:LamG-like jellyroll fold domain-containing protein [Pelosinus sp. IPA-1]|uniref:LamG domain-containing protein n=1 Tax=Pelosinus sp. IPA-1 TaxID=3029569 RepID=UPI00243627C8|nr:LamG-like jellyroll fold domain-containing protein [Pelosinus sp. IPA-1]GMB01472.1 hypothetical protein PIPA1_42710 [Pelosinus sp. IPA-1]
MYEVDQYTVSLLHFEDGVKDECGKVWTVKGGAATSTVQKKNGSSSLYVPKASSSYISTPITNDLQFGSSDWTFETYAMFTSAGSIEWVINSYKDDGNYFGIVYVSGTLEFQITVNGKTYLMGATPNLKLNQWYHLAFVRKESTLYGFVDGTLIGTLPYTGALPMGRSVVIGTGGWSNTEAYDKCFFDGYVDEFRISNVARWTSDFTHPVVINAPTNLIATAGDSQVTLSWDAVADAISYNVKRSTTAGGPYTVIATNVNGTNYVDKTVTNGTTYYYVVTAVDASGNESTNSNEAFATPKAPSGYGLLRITMSDSSEREYKLSTSEIDDFVKWFNRTIGTGTTGYVFSKAEQKSKEYLSFEKIISFEVIPLTA